MELIVLYINMTLKMSYLLSTPELEGVNNPMRKKNLGIVNLLCADLLYLLLRNYDFREIIMSNSTKKLLAIWRICLCCWVSC